MGWREAERSKRFIEKYGKGRSDDFKREAVREGYVERYSALMAGMKAGLVSESWRKNVQISAYNGFGQPWWDAVIPEAYDNHWQPTKRAYHVYSMQSDMMHLHFRREKARAAPTGDTEQYDGGS